MCRWLAYLGGPLYLDELIFQPEHSLIDQSLNARVTETTTNGDGFGVGWYGLRTTPGVYRDVMPAWNDLNLRNLTVQIRSHLFLAHVRSATGSAVQRTNCHPFRHGRWLFVHNGQIFHFGRVKRALVLSVSADLYPEILGTSDSEAMFYLALTFGLEEDPVGAVERMVGHVERVCAEHGIRDPVQMTLGVTDGRRIYAFRYSSKRQSRSLYHSKSVRAIGELNPEVAADLPDDAVAVVSEPLTHLDTWWDEIPESTAVVVSDGKVERVPFEPQVP